MQKIQWMQPDGFWLVTGAALLWGTIGVSTQAIYNMDSTTSLFINLARMLIATPIMLVACWRVVGSRMFAIRQRDLGLMLITGILLAMYQAAYFIAIRHTGVTIATLLTLCATPLIVAGISVLLGLETLTGRLLIALVCALIGSVLLVGIQAPAGSDYNMPLGVAFSLLSAAGYASMIVCGRFLAGGYHPLQVTTVTFGVGTVALLLINLVSGVVTVHTTQGWLLVLYLGLVPTALAYWLFQTGLRSVSATSASIVSLIESVAAAGLAWWLFGETLATTGIAGAGLLLLSIYVLSVGKGA